MPSAPAGKAIRLALITRDPALERFVARGAEASMAETVDLTPADWRMALKLDADAVLVGIEPGCERDLDMIARLAGEGARVVALAAGGSINLAVEAMRRGACDFILQPSRPEALFDRLAERLAQMPQAGSGEHSVPAEAGAGDSFIGDTPAMAALYRQIRRIAPSSAPAFITGESGTGKELCATALHRRSGRAADRFVAINCAAIPRDLMESELFGHARGAFTGASEDRPGAMQLADGGTLFLDEICEMDLSLQAKLLRALQTGSVRRVGASADERVNVRFVCATNRDPEAEMAAGRFRADLFYRLHVLPLHLPPLRERGGDVLKLASHFLARFAAEEDRHFSGFSPEAERFLASYDWPGNVRQLENLVRRIVVMHDGDTVTAEMIPLALAHSGGEEAGPATSGVLHLMAAANAPVPPGPVEPFWMQEKRIIEQALQACGGHVGKAAAALEISASTIYRKKLSWDDNAALSA